MADEVTPGADAPEPSLLGGATEGQPEGEPSLLAGAEAEGQPESQTPEGETPPAEGDKPEDKPEGAPEAYEDFAAPEGVELDTEVLGSFKEVAKEFNLSQPAAQKMVDMAASLVQKQQAAFQQQIADTTAGWRNASVSDKEFGGTNLQENLKIAATARDKFATPELKAFLDESRLGDHPEVVRLFVKIGKAIGEDSLVSKGNSKPTPSFYDHPTSKRA